VGRWVHQLEPKFTITDSHNIDNKGEAADQDETFWGADVWKDDDDESFSEQDDEPDEFDSDFNDTEDDGDDDDDDAEESVARKASKMEVSSSEEE
jgi:hypothetical protein